MGDPSLRTHRIAKQEQSNAARRCRDRDLLPLVVEPCKSAPLTLTPLRLTQGCYTCAKAIPKRLTATMGRLRNKALTLQSKAKSSMNPNVPRNAPGRARWAELVADIRQGLPEGRAQLYEIFSSGLRVMLGRQVAEPFLSSVVTDVLTDVVWAIQHDELKTPDDLPSLIRKSARRRVHANVPRLPIAPVTVDPEFQGVLSRSVFSNSKRYCKSIRTA